MGRASFSFVHRGRGSRQMSSSRPAPAEWPADAYVSGDPHPALGASARPDADFSSFLDFGDAPLIGAVSRHQLDLAVEYDVPIEVEVEPDADRQAPDAAEHLELPRSAVV